MSSQTLDRNSVQSKIAELRNVIDFIEPRAAEQKALNDFVDEVQSKSDQIFSECDLDLSSLSNEDLNEFICRLKNELNEVDGENVRVESEIEEFQRRCAEGYGKLDSELETLSCSLELIESESPEKAKKDTQVDVCSIANHQADFSNAQCSKFKMLELSHQIEKNKISLKSLQEIDSIFKRFEAVEGIENALTGLRVLEVEGDSIKLSLKTYIPYLEMVLRQQDIEGVIEPLELNHELIIGTEGGTLELKNVKISPNDIYVGEIIDAAKSLRQHNPTCSDVETRSSLEWFVRRVQDKIALTSVRRLVVEKANKSRHSFEYLDKEDIILARVVGGVDAFIKLPQGWPLSDLALELISLKSTTQYSKEISLSFLCKIVEVANSLNANLRQKISSFADSIEEILMKEMRAELHSHGTAN